jgi:hypothetical protein
MECLACATRTRSGLAAWPLVVALSACGGQSEDSLPASGGAGGGPWAGGAGGMTNEVSVSYRTLDDMDEEEGNSPAGLPPSGFYWTTSSTSGGIGNWFVQSAEGKLSDAMIDEIVPHRDGSRRACHVTGADYARGVDLFAQLNHPTSRPADLSAFRGIAFWARLTSQSGKLVVAIGDGRSYFIADDALSPLPSHTFAVSDQWQHFELSFESIGADPSRVVSLEFVGGEGGEPFELWVDDVAFVCSGACP